MMGQRGNVKIALQSLRSAKWRSLLTVLGIIIGVVSVVTTVSLGEGVREQIKQQINQRGDDLITVLPGQQVQRDSNGAITSFNPLGGGNVFSEADYKSIEAADNLRAVAPFASVTGLATSSNRSFSGNVIASTDDVPELLNQEVSYGTFFKDDDHNRDFAVIGRRVAEELFGENIPVGKSFELRGHSFVVRGIFDEFGTGPPVLLGTDYNAAIFIPYDVGRELMGGNIQIHQVLAKPASGVSTEKAADTIRTQLLESHAGQEDFTVLRQAELLAAASNLLGLLTQLIAGIAAISLLVGGIGIMNIMFVAVTERTREIGIRKAVGATNRQIMNQFMTEAMILGLVGGLIGVLASVIINILLRILTDLQPVVTLPVMGIATGVALIVGLVFGVTPALRAARKDPIESLRYE